MCSWSTYMFQLGRRLVWLVSYRQARLGVGTVFVEVVGVVGVGRGYRGKAIPLS